MDGEEVHFTMPSEFEVSTLVATSELDLKKRLGIYLWLCHFIFEGLTITGVLFD